MKKLIIFLVACLSVGMLHANHWTPIEEGQYAYSMTIWGVISIDGVEQYSDQLEVGVFCGDECRGTAFASEFFLTHRYLAEMNVYGENGHQLTFKLYDHSSNQELVSTSTEAIAFTLDGYGNPIEPYVMNFTPVVPSTIFHFITVGNWSNASNWSGGTLPGANDAVSIDANCTLNGNAVVASLTVTAGKTLTLQSGKTLTVTGNLTNTATTGLVIEDGAQLKHASENVNATVKKSIAGHGTNAGKYYLISNPLTSVVNPEMSSVYHLITGNYDFYDWLPSTPDNLEWRNFKDNSYLMSPEGYGYLYANQNGVELLFPGTLKPSHNRYAKSVSYDSSDAEHPGWNLIGNPFVCNACLVNENNEPLPFYRMNAAGDGFEAVAPGTPIAPMEGVFYKALGNGMVSFIRADFPSDTHEYVDLGLPSGLLWATCNVGANAPEEYGDYFAWGETTPKDDYSWLTYQYGNWNQLTKYCSNSIYGSNGFTDNLTTLLPEDDAATANWYSDWRLPTNEEWQELYNNTSVTWITQNGVNGRLFTASNGNSLFMPAAGYRNSGNLYYAGSNGYYRSSSLYMDNPNGAWYFNFRSDGYLMSGSNRSYGQSVRAVRSSGWNNAPTGSIDGLFSVSEDQQVYFSQGNLQYQASTNTWKFAGNQYDYVGSDNNNISSTYSGWIDLFGWGTSGYNHGANCYQPWSTSTSYSDYYVYGSSSYNLNDQTGDADWGVFNPISNGGNQANQWRTLTQHEWTYVFNTRNTTSGIRYAKANVNNVNGIILLPDDWNSSTYSLSNTNSSGASFSSNTLTASQWSTLEQAGAVFLPAAGYRDGSSVYNVGSNGYYWSASYRNSGLVRGVNFLDSNLNAGYSGSRYSGRSVRLVRFAENYSFNINASPSPVEGGAVIGAGDYEASAECTLTAMPSSGYFFVNWTENGSVVSTYANYTFIVTSDRNLVANFSVSPTGSIDGLFSVSEGQQVYFSQGNLQYQASTNTWKFAEHQYDYVGTQIPDGQGNVGGTVSDSDNRNISSTYSGWIDLFGWGTSGWNSGNTYYHPWDSNNSSGSTYGPPGQYDLTGSYANADWGVFNPISNGGNQANQWRTLTQPEWDYVFNTRSTTSGVRYAKANVNNVNGVILLPDDWSTSTYSLSNANSGGASFSSNVITASQWNTLEQAGAVFLPAAGYRGGTSVYYVGSRGCYLSVSNCSDCAFSVDFNDSFISMSISSYRYYGQSVRLVRVAE